MERVGASLRTRRWTWMLLTAALSLAGLAAAAAAQTVDDALLDEAARRSGLSREEIQRRLDQRTGNGQAETELVAPGRVSLEGIDDSRSPSDPAARWRDTDERAILPYQLELATEQQAAAEAVVVSGDSLTLFGSGFFHLDQATFTPPSFGAVGDDYVLGAGDEVIVNAWGGVDFKLERIVDRDGSILLPRSGKVACAGRTLAQVQKSVREHLAESHASIRNPDGEGGTTVEVTLGHLRPIKVFVTGAVQRPGAVELNSASRILTAVAAAGGPLPTGSLRRVRLVRGAETVGELDLYSVLLGQGRAGDLRLREGDTVYVPDIGPRVRLAGAVRRPAYYEMLPGETLSQALRFAGGLTATAAGDVIHIERIVPFGERRSGQPDLQVVDVAFDPAAGVATDGPVALRDGDRIEVGEAPSRLRNFVRIEGAVKRPGRYEFREGMSAGHLVDLAGGLWPDALVERAVIDRTSEQDEFSSLAFALAGEMDGSGQPVLLQPRDVLHVFSRWDTQERPQVNIAGEVYEPHQEPFRKGMTLRDLILKAGGLKQSADRVHVEVARIRQDAMQSRDTDTRPNQTVDVHHLDLPDDFLTSGESLELQPWDRVFVRRLPWWEMQSTITLRGQVFYPGQFSLERRDEKLSSLIERAGGLKPDAYLPGARVLRRQDDVGNIAIDLARALEEPGGPYDIILQDGDEILIPDRMYTVKVLGEVGFPTSLVFNEGENINWYVDRAGGYLEKADKGKSRVVWPNGMSFPNKRGTKVIAGSTIIVPLKAPPEGEGKLATLREISAIFASLATVWLVIDRTN